MKIDIRDRLGVVGDQGRRGTCVAFALTACHEELFSLQYSLSEESLHWGAKNHQKELEGVSFEMAKNALITEGQSDYEYWKYDENVNDSIDYFPPPAAWRSRPWHKCTLRKIDPNVDAIISLLADGKPVAVIIKLHRGFYLERGTTIKNELNPQWIGANHAVVLVGISEDSDFVLVRNSWGFSWGDRGHALLSTALLKRIILDAAILLYP